MNKLFEKLADEINQIESWKEITTSDKHPFCACETETVSRSKVLRILRNGLKDFEKELNTTKIRETELIAVIERAKTLLAAYRDMFDRSENEDRFYGKTLPELTVVYDDAECNASCLRDDIESLLDDIEDLDLPSEKTRTEVMR